MIQVLEETDITVEHQLPILQLYKNAYNSPLYFTQPLGIMRNL